MDSEREQPFSAKSKFSALEIARIPGARRGHGKTNDHFVREAPGPGSTLLLLEFSAKNRNSIKTFPRVARSGTWLLRGSEEDEREAKGRRKSRTRGTRDGARGWRKRERDENAFAYEIKWRIYTVRSQYTYVRPTVNYTVNRGVLFDRRGKEDRAHDEDEG